MRILLMFAVLVLAVSTTHGESPMTKQTLYDFTVKDIRGNDVSLSTFKGKAVLIVNVASECGYTTQYEGLQKLYAKYKDKGFVILGFPANNFGSQEPGTNEEIAKFCSSRYSVTFPMFAKISVYGHDMHPLYAMLTSAAAPAGEVSWNFEKFLVGKDGTVLKRYKSRVKPESAELTADIEAALK
ncbi:MAG: glutathione peroxidase [Candidatus Kapaibacterium sp.]